ncbi:MAG: hypothetical protein HY246_06890 [Proteobacteria bacterium]|nr:hypothetical protein [Pseudomonadota bacterium]
MLGGCSFASDTLWPSLSGSDPRSGGSQAQRVAIPPSSAEQNPQPTMSPAGGTASGRGAIAQAPTPAPITATAVGQRATQMRDDVQRLQGSVNGRSTQLQQFRAEQVQIAQRYYGIVAGINARLQVGTTPGNPNLQGQWNQANQELERIATEIGRMSQLSNQVAADAATASFLLESTRAAYSLSGAVEEDHRALATLEDEVNRTVVSIDRQLNELSEDVNRQTAYVGRERSNMTALSVAIKNGELFGTGLNNRPFAAVAPADGSPARLGAAPGQTPRTANPASAAVGNRPLVVIRFDRPNPSYEQALYTAVSRALERRPEAAFDLVAVSPGRGNQAQVALASTNAKRQAETVLRSLTNMGLTPDRINLSATTSGNVQTNEVHLFVR